MNIKIFLITFFLLPSLVFASDIVLKSGEKIQGKIVEKTDKYIKVDEGIGIPITYYADAIDTVDGKQFFEQSSIAPASKPKQKSAKAYLYQSIIDIQHHNLIDAVSDCYKALEIDPLYAEAHIALAHIHLLTKDYDKAWIETHKVEKLGGAVDPRFMQYILETSPEGGQQQNVISYYSKLVETDPKNADAYNFRGLAYEMQGNLPEALSDYSKAIEIHPDFADAYINRGLVYDREGNLTEAISDYTKVIGIDPKLAVAYLDRGLAYDEQNKNTEAIADYTKAIEINPKYAKYYNQRAIDYSNEGNLTQAMKDYTKAIELRPNYAIAYSNRGVINEKLKNLTQSIEDFNKAIDIQPDFADAYRNRGWYFIYAKFPDKALSDFEKLVELRPDDPQSYYDRAIGHFYKGEYNKSWDDVHQVQKMGGKVDPGLMTNLKWATGKDK